MLLNIKTNSNEIRVCEKKTEIANLKYNRDIDEI